MKNQTEKDWLEKSGQEDLGTGVFLHKSDDSQTATKKSFIQNITYQECEKIGENSIAFKWVPNWFMSYENITKTSCSIESKNA